MFLLAGATFLMPPLPVATPDNRGDLTGLPTPFTLPAAEASSGRETVHVRPPDTRISEENSRRIRVGMTQADVERIFGRPPGDYVRPAEENQLVYYPPCISLHYWHNRQGKLRTATWRGDDGVVIVGFDGQGKVAKTLSCLRSAPSDRP